MFMQYIFILSNFLSENFVRYSFVDFKDIQEQKGFIHLAYYILFEIKTDYVYLYGTL